MAVLRIILVLTCQQLDTHGVELWNIYTHHLVTLSN